MGFRRKLGKKKSQVSWSDSKNKPKMSSKAGSTTSGDQQSINSNCITSEVVLSGWLHKWTNYLKGYRQRWFVLDSDSVLSYYRNPGEVGQSCRGSIKLQEARILSDKLGQNIVVSAQSQAFHLKAGNDIDRQKWLQALEYSRHKAIKQAESDEDEDAHRNADGSRLQIIEGINRDLDEKLGELRAAVKILGKHSDELIHCVGDSGIDEKTLSERATLVKITTAAVLKAAEEFVDHSDKGAHRLKKALTTEQKEKVVLQEQLEALAKQHTVLERAATISHSNAPISAYSDDDDFHDALETLSIYNTDGGRGSRSNSHVEVDTMSNSAHAPVPGSSVVAIPDGASRIRRKQIPERPNLPLNLWSVMKNCIGKDLSKIPMPVNFSEPLSVLQRITEDLEYSCILDAAADKDPLVQLCHVAAYGVSNYSTTGNRTNKPFNPLLGETYECDRMADKGWRSVAEQVSHHPPAAAHHAEGRGWTMFQDFTMTSRFRGKFLSVIPVGYTHVNFAKHDSKFSYKKITTTVHNIIVGKLWIDNHGDMEIINHTTGDKCILKFFPYAYFSKEVPRRVYGIVKDSAGVPRYVVQGTWDKNVDMLKVTNYSGNGEKMKVETDENPIRIWTCNPPYPGSAKMHNFTQFAIELNEPEDGTAPTDSRLRPDQRMMEDGRWDESNQKKQQIEEKQRTVRRQREALAEKAMANGERYEEYQPIWFTKEEDSLTGALMHSFKGDYWDCKAKGDWSRCPDIF